jgi:hypothetical protein
MALSSHPCPGCGGPIHRGYTRCHICLKTGTRTAAPQPAPPRPTVETDLRVRRQGTELSSLRDKYTEALHTIERQAAQLSISSALKSGLDTCTIVPKHGQGTSEGTAVLVASDWHIEEVVGAEVGGLNRFDPEIAKARADRFFQSSLRLIRLLQQDIQIHTVVLALLGDFITGDIHGAENAELNDLLPTHAIVTAQNMLISGVEFLLTHTTAKFVIPCHSGNHSRTTMKTRFSAENGHSLEYLLYLHLAAYFRSEPRVTFLVADGPHSYLDVYGQTIRFQHGHMIKYGGGVGGIFIPANKAVAMWNRARHADLDVFGHFHQLVDGGNFLCNGSLIGYNGFALSIKASFEPPRQLLFLLDKKRGRTCSWPILLS